MYIFDRGYIIISIRKRPTFRFGSGFGWFWPVRFGKKFCGTFAESFSIQFHAHSQYTGIKLTDYAILCNKLFSQPHHNATIHISKITFYVVKLSACCGEGFYIHAFILYIVLAKLYMLRFLET